jgi:hypothetical protein
MLENLAVISFIFVAPQQLANESAPRTTDEYPAPA